LEWGNRSNEKIKRLITEGTEIGAKRAQRRGKERKKERKKESTPPSEGESGAPPQGHLMGDEIRRKLV
jgi:hypothetical protein